METLSQVFQSPLPAGLGVYFCPSLSFSLLFLPPFTLGGVSQRHPLAGFDLKDAQVVRLPLELQHFHVAGMSQYFPYL